MGGLKIQIYTEVVLEQEGVEEILALVYDGGNTVGFYLAGEFLFCAEWRGNLEGVFRDCLKLFSREMGE